MSALTLQRDVNTDGNGFIYRLHLPVQFMNIIVGDKRCNSDRKKTPQKTTATAFSEPPVKKKDHLRKISLPQISVHPPRSHDVTFISHH